MILNIFLRDGNNVQVSSFETFIMAFRETITHEASEIDSVKLDDNTTYIFKGENTVMVSGKDILYLDIS